MTAHHSSLRSGEWHVESISIFSSARIGPSPNTHLYYEHVYSLYPSWSERFPFQSRPMLVLARSEKAGSDRPIVLEPTCSQDTHSACGSRSGRSTCGFWLHHPANLRKLLLSSDIMSAFPREWACWYLTRASVLHADLLYKAVPVLLHQVDYQQ